MKKYRIDFTSVLIVYLTVLLPLVAYYLYLNLLKGEFDKKFGAGGTAILSVIISAVTASLPTLGYMLANLVSAIINKHMNIRRVYLSSISIGLLLLIWLYPTLEMMQRLVPPTYGPYGFIIILISLVMLGFLVGLLVLILFYCTRRPVTASLPNEE